MSPGTGTLLGTGGNDVLRTDDTFTTLLGGRGNDEFFGGSDRDRIEKFYGGEGDDLFHWSPGFNIVHGGQPGLDYAQDGADVMDYSGAGEVRIAFNRYWIPHKVPNYVAVYGRLLAHLFLEENGERVWVQGRLLSTGHARAYGLPDSFACARELLAHERVAREAETGLWANAAYATRAAVEAGKLLRYRNSYQIVEGSVVRVKAAKSRTYLDFGRDWRTDFSAGIDTQDPARQPGVGKDACRAAGAARGSARLD